MKRAAHGMLVSLLILAAGCGGNEPTSAEVAAEATPENIEETIASEVERATGRKPVSGESVCEILDAALVREQFGVPAETEIAVSPSKYSPHPLCTATWDKPNIEELQKKRQEALMAAMTARAQGKEAALPRMNLQNEVSLTVYEPEFTSSSAAQSAFDQAMQRLQNGISTEVQGKSFSVQADLTPVSGIGDRAMWAESMRQLSIVDGTRIVHVAVKHADDPAADLETAKRLASKLLERI